MQNARSTAAISRASEGYHFSHDALVTCKLPIVDSAIIGTTVSTRQIVQLVLPKGKSKPMLYDLSRI